MPSRLQTPQYFYLLWQEDLNDIKSVLIAIRDRREEVVRNWHSLYVLFFGEKRVLSEEEFANIYEPSLLKNTNNLLDKDMAAYADGVLALGRQLAEMGVPLQEIIASLHLYEEAARSVFPKGALNDADVCAKFDKVSHARIILLTDAFLRSQTALSTARIRALETEARSIPLSKRTSFHGLVGQSEPMRRLFQRIEAAAHALGTIFIVGESGSGKELVAQAIRECGMEPDAPYLILNCAALPKDLIEGELFGYLRGAFSGANADYLGMFRSAEGGVLFLDEITEMTPDVQAKLLRAIEARKVRPLGSAKEVPVNVRIIASTNRDPHQAMHAGQLREDLYFRLQAGEIKVPPLRERLDDLPLLAEYFIDFFNQKQSRASGPVEGIEDAALAAMKSYKWPGNVRELANSIERAFTFGRESAIGLADLPEAIGGSPVRLEPSPAKRGLTFKDAEREVIRRALEMVGGNRTHAAEILQITRKRLRSKMTKYGLE
jgi:transcriptional regulator with PAS, ATPase and Fis domain